MSMLTYGMVGMGTATLATGLVLVRPRVAAASGAGKVLVFGPVLEATALSMFAAEHFLAASTLAPIVPDWLPAPLFWTYLVGAALLATAISFVSWRSLRWSASLLALLFLIIVATVDLPNLGGHYHQRLFWTLTLRETCFAAGAMVLAGSQWPRGWARTTLLLLGRLAVACVFFLYAAEHFHYPLFVPGVPLSKLTPDWVPAPEMLTYFVGATLLIAGIGLLIPRTRRIAAAAEGIVLLLLTVCLYVPMLITELHTPNTLENLNYVGDTLLFASTTLLAGFGASQPKPAEPAAS